MSRGGGELAGGGGRGSGCDYVESVNPIRPLGASELEPGAEVERGAAATSLRQMQRQKALSPQIEVEHQKAGGARPGSLGHASQRSHITWHRFLLFVFFCFFLIGSSVNSRV